MRVEGDARARALVLLALLMLVHDVLVAGVVLMLFVWAERAAAVRAGLGLLAELLVWGVLRAWACVLVGAARPVQAEHGEAGAVVCVLLADL